LLQCHEIIDVRWIYNKMKRLGLLLVVLTLIWTQGLVVIAQAGLIATVTSTVSLRSGPGTDWRRLASLPVGTTIALDGRSGDATWVRGITQNGDVGWVVQTSLSISVDQAFSLPVILREDPVTVGAPPPGAVPNSAAPAADTGGPAAPVVANTPVRGFSYGGHVKFFGEAAVNAMRRAGMTWAKHQVRYFRGMSPDGAAGIIADTHAKGFHVLLGVVGSPAELLTPGYYDEYAAYLAGLAAAGADAIEVWNEPNIDREWPTGQISGAMYTDLLAKAYNAIKAANPNTLVISGAPAPTGFFGGCQAGGCDDAVFIQQMAQAGAARYMDCVGVHYNEGIVPPTQTSGDPRSEYFTRYYPSMVSTYSRAFGGRKPLCFTELGYLSPEGLGPLPPGFQWAQNVTVAQQANWLGQIIRAARRSGNVRLVIVWNVDFQQYDADPMAGYAIIRPDGSCPACDTIGQ
jgi:uncharacterized protein YraI